MESGIDHRAARELLEWQIELGATEAIGDAPVDRYALPDRPPEPAAARGAEARGAATGAPPPVAPVVVAADAAGSVDPVAMARAAAGAATSLDELRAAIAGFDLCELKKGARNTVFADGVPGAPVMIIGEAPGRDEDRAGRPFVGRAGRLLDRMLASIGLDRAKNVYITNVLPWRPPQNRDPRPEEIAMMRPFLERHVALAGPKILVLMGNASCQAVLGRRGITRLRGRWEQAFDRPALPMFHPAFLLRKPHTKREAWADLLELKARLRGDA